MHAVRRDPELQRFYRRKLAQKGLGKARIAAARKLGIRLWIMLRDQIGTRSSAVAAHRGHRDGDYPCGNACVGRGPLRE